MTTTTYETKTFKIKNTEYSVVIASGLNEYVAVKKMTANPFATLGKEFQNFGEAISHYKNPQIKVELLKIELGL